MERSSNGTLGRARADCSAAGFGSQRQPSSIQVADLEAKPAAEQQQQRPVSARGPSSSAAVQLPHTNSAGSPEPTSRSNSDGGSFSVALPAVSRGQVLATCTQISLLLAAAGLGLHELTPLIPPALRVGQEEAVQALLQCECRQSRGLREGGRGQWRLTCFGGGGEGTSGWLGSAVGWAQRGMQAQGNGVVVDGWPRVWVDG